MLDSVRDQRDSVTQVPTTSDDRSGDGVDVLSSGIHRFEYVQAQQHDGDWWVACSGEQELVLPAGVLRNPDYDQEPTRLEATLHDLYEDLRLTATLTGAAAAGHLAEHVRSYGYVDLCKHGLPLWHTDRPFPQGTSRSCVRPVVPRSEALGVRVTDAQCMSNSLDAVADIYDRLHRRTDITRRVTKDLLSWPVLRKTADPW